MKKNQLNRGETQRVMYIENKEGTIDGVSARIGWATFSKTGKSVHYRGRLLRRSSGQGILGNFFDDDTGEEYWVSGIKKRGSNVQFWSETINLAVDEDAKEEYRKLKTSSTL